jgi:hypothetical protein
LTFTQEEIDLIGFGWILGVLLGGDDRETAIDALRASATMGMQHRHVVNARAASRISYQIAAPISRYPFDDIRFCQPKKRIIHIEGAIDDVGKQAANARENLWMRGSGSASADDLANRRQVEADHPIFKNGEFVSAKKSRSHRSKGSKQKGSGSVRQLLTEIAIESCPYRDVEHAVGAVSALKLIDQVRLCFGDLGTRPVAYKHNFIVLHGEPINGSG